MKYQLITKHLVSCFCYISFQWFCTSYISTDQELRVLTNKHHTIMANNKSFQQIDVFGLFNDLYTKGSTKLSDHFINDDPGTAGDSSRDPEK